MKKTAFLFLSLITFLACDTDDDTATTTESTVSINFTQSFDGDSITANEFNNISYTNENGEQLSLSRLRYLMSDIVLTDENGIATVLADYNFINVADGSGSLIVAPTTFEEGNYTLSMRFGFSDADNTDGAYPELNVADWSVPGPLGGGYHYMQMEGMYINSDGANTNYQYHTIRAAENPGADPILTDTSIAVNLGNVTIEGVSTNIEVNMNIEEWYRNPILWDLNVDYTMLMPNHLAQKRMNQNGQNVFNLGAVVSAFAL